MNDEDKDFIGMVLIPFGVFFGAIWALVYFGGGC